LSEIAICDVGPRDGLQNERVVLAPAVRSSVGGIGGCPFAPRATGNIGTEDHVYLFEEMGVGTGIDLAALIDSSAWVGHQLGMPLPALVSRAGPFPEPAL